MAGVVEDDPRAPLKRKVLELRVVTVEAVELHNMTGAALLVGDLVQIETDALMLLVAGRAVELAFENGGRRKCDVLDARRRWCGDLPGDLRQPLRTLLQNLLRGAVCVEGGLRHLVTGEACLAVSEWVAGDKAVCPGQLPAAALGVAGAALLDRPMSTGQWPGHQELRALGEKGGRGQAGGGYDRKKCRDEVAPGARRHSPFGRARPADAELVGTPHHQAPEEKA